MVSRPLANPGSDTKSKAIHNWMSATWMTQVKFNVLLAILDPNAANTLFETVNYFKTYHPQIRSAFANAASWFISQAFIANRQTGTHRDGHSAPAGLDGLLTFGHYQGGHLELVDKKSTPASTVPEVVNVSIPYGPMTGILFRGSLFPHRVSPYQSIVGKDLNRFAMAFFCDREVLLHAGFNLPYPVPREDHLAWIAEVFSSGMSPQTHIVP